MEVIPSERSHSIFWEQLIYTEAMLLAHEETKPMAESVTTAIGEFDTLQTDNRLNQRKVIQSKAKSNMADNSLDHEMRKTQSTMLHEVGQDRSSKSYRTIFHTDIGSLTRYSLKRQLEIAEEMVRKIDLPGIPEAIRTDHKPRLEVAIAHGKEAIEERKIVQFKYLEHKMNMDEWKDNVNSIRLSVYSMLLQLASKTRRKPRWANTFFARVSRNRKLSKGTGTSDLISDPSPNITI